MVEKLAADLAELWVAPKVDSSVHAAVVHSVEMSAGMWEPLPVDMMAEQLVDMMVEWLGNRSVVH